MVLMEGGSRMRNQPAPPAAVFEALMSPDRDPARPWLILLQDERQPRILELEEASRLTWSSLWVKRPDARVRFDLSPAGGGTDLRWTLLLQEPLPEPGLLGHFRKRLNELINRDLRFTFGQ
jgi:hypothetical protein